MKKLLTTATFLSIAAMAAVPAAVQATPELTVTIGSNTSQTFTSGSSFSIQNAQNNGVTVSVQGASDISSTATSNNNINANGINILNTTGSTQTLTIDIQDTGFTANGSLNNELYYAQESFGGEIAAGSASFVFTTTATPDTANGTSAQVVYSSGTYTTTSTSTKPTTTPYATGGGTFAVPAQTSSSSLVLSPGNLFTIDSHMVVTLSANASVDLLNDNTISTVVPTGTSTPEPASAALAMTGLVPMFFLRRRKA
ncbi:MAG: hypothetical protein ACP5O1_05125 [Phycisphaerae bacterium]